MEMATVLVVEDETLIRELVAEELEEAGYTVVIANNADQRLLFSKPVRTSTSYSPISTCRAPWTG
jgi:CheY-like chemotaxis protein